MPNAIANLISGAIASTASCLDGKVTRAGSWFDGFWDFYVQNRDHLLSEPAWEIQGLADDFPWAIEMMAPDALDRPVFELYLFVEARDPRPDVSAPWPVSEVVVIPGDEPARLGTPDAFDRPHNETLAQALRCMGFVPKVGYWGVRCESRVHRDNPTAIVHVHAILSALAQALQTALALAADLPR